MVYFTVRKKIMKVVWFTVTIITRIHMLINIKFVTINVYMDKRISNTTPVFDQRSKQ